METQENKEIPQMQIRAHRGGLDESIATMKTIDATMDAVKQYMAEHGGAFPFEEEELNSVTVVPYSDDNETRIDGWNGPTCLIVYRPQGKGAFTPFGMCSSMVGEPEIVSSINPELARMIVDLAPAPVAPVKLEYTAEKAQKYIRDMLKQMINGGLAGNVMEHTLKMVLNHPAFEQYNTTSSDVRLALPPEIEEQFADLEARIADARFAIESVVPMIIDSKGFENNLKVMRNNRDIPIYNEAATTLGCNTKYYIGLRGKWGWLHLYNSN